MRSTQLRNLLFYAILPSLAVYFCVLTFSSFYGIEPGLVIRDLIQTCDYPIGVGMISNLGVLLWGFAGSICLFCSNKNIIHRNSWRKFLLMGGILSLFLCIDDFFLLHDRYISQDINI